MSTEYSKQIWSIEPLNSEQIRSFLEKRIVSTSKIKNEQKVKEILLKIDSIYDLSELAKRPILLEMICTTIDKIAELQVSGAAEDIRNIRKHGSMLTHQKVNSELLSLKKIGFSFRLY